jgi:serine/threonine-protein kinase
MYEALAGAKPFTGDTPLAVAMAVVHAEPEPLAALRPDVDPQLAVVVETAMQRDPAARFASAADMQRALAAATSAAPPDAEMATLVEHPDQTSVLPAVAVSPAPAALSAAPAWFRRRRAAVLLAAAVVVVAVALAVAMASGHDRGSVNSPATGNSPSASVTSSPAITTPTTQVSIQVQVPAQNQTVPARGKGGKHRRGNG